MIRFACPACGKICNANDESAGRRGKCPACGAAMQVPHASVIAKSAPPAPPPLRQSALAPSASAWYYMKPGLLYEERTGPVTDEEMYRLAFEGTIKPKILVSHSVQTSGGWVSMDQIASLNAKYEEGVQARQQQKKEESEAKTIARQQRQEAIQAQRQAAIQQAAEQRANSPIARFLLDGQSEAVVAKLYDRVGEILTQNESIEYMAVQAKPIAISPDCVVITTRRFIIFRQKLLGQMDFDDYLWLHLHDARMKEGVMYAEVSFQSTDGRRIGVDYLPKAQARRIYRIGQEREEAALETRRSRWMEEQRAGASNVVVNTAVVPAETMNPQTQQPGPARFRKIPSPSCKS